MTEGSAPGQDSYLVGGNLLNEQDNVLKAKESHEAAEKELAERESAERESAAGRTEPEPEPEPEPVPEEPQSITEEQQTHGGGAVPPGADQGDA